MIDNIGLNQIFPIYNENGTPFHDLVLRKGVVDSIVMSLGDKITGDVFYKDNTLQVTMKEYVVYNGIHYSLVNPPTIVREGMVADNGELKGMTKYSFEFYHPMYMLGNFPFTDVAVQPSQEKYLSQNKTFSWIGYLADYVDKINKNLDGTQWIVVIGSSVQQEELTKLSDVLSFDNVTIADALKTGYETWKVPYVVDVVASDSPYYAQGKRFMVQYGLPTTEIVDGGGNPFVFHYGQGVGLKNNSRTPRNNKIVTRIAGYGSENNIPYGYPQIVWYGNSDWDYTINNNQNNPLSYPIYKGIVGGRYVKLIKHPFTRNHLMPSIYSQTVFNKVSPYVSGGGANPNYNPSIEIKDYYDADNTYDNPIKQGEQSYEIHQFEDIKPELTHEYKLQAVVPYDEHAASKNFVTKESFLGSVLNRATSTEIALERTQMLALYNSINNNTAYNSSGSDDSYEYSCTTTSNSGYFTVTYKSSNFNFKSVILIAEQAPEWDDTMDEDGNYLQSYFQITLPQLTFDIYACAAITQEMKINMRSGACIGCTFPVQVDWDDYKNNFYDNDGNFTPTGSQRDYTKYPDSSQGTITILVQKENETFGTLMPNIYQKPQAGDEFVVLGISLPLSYITNAEQRLDDAMKQYMRENNVYYYDYPLKFDEHFLATYPSVLNQMKNNVLVRFDYAGTEHALYIKQMAVRYGDKPLPQYDITLTDDVEIVLNQIGKTAEEVSNLRIILGEQERRSLSLEELDARYLRKDVDDDAAGMIRLIRGIQVGEQFVTGLLGEGGVFRRDDDGKTYLETDRLYVRMKAYFDTVEIRKYQHSSGNRIASNAGIKCSRVEYIDANGNVTTNIASAVRFRCYFKASEGDKTITNDFIVGDLAFCGETNINTGGLSQRRYWRAVVGKSSSIDANGEQYIDLSVSDCETGSDVPIAQDDIIQLGNKTDTTRQGAIIEFVSGSDAPSYQIYQGINTYSLNNKNYVGMGYNSSTGRAYMNVFGDFRFGYKNDSGSFIKYNAGSGQLDIKARINASSPVVDGNNTYNNMEDYIEAHSSDWTEEDINNLIHGVTDPIQQQIDGEIDTWFYEGTPTLNNTPASEWATETLKERHLGDLYYDIGTGATAGFAYRFVRTGNDGNYTYSWQYLEDTAITEALAMAANAQDTADHKRRIFVLPVTIDGTTYNYPYPPYDVGDLWVNAKYPHDTGATYNNEILKCKTAKSSGSFAISDWDKASKYTDDSYAHGFDFLTSNLARLSSTQIDGGLVLSSLIGLRDASNNIQSGISGIVEATKKGSGIAAWYGGEQGDKEDQSHYTGITRWAKSLFRFDGSGYLADGNITWDAAGSVTIRNITTLYDSQNTDILNQLTTFSNMFRNSTWGSGQSTELRIQPQQHFDHINLTRGTGSVGGDSHYFDITDVSVLNYGEMKSRFITIDFFNRLFQAYSNADHADVHKILPNDVQTTVNNLKILVGTWTEQYISALGLSSSGGGGGGSSTLEGLNDVEYVGTPTTGQILKYNANTHKWYNGDDSGLTLLYALSVYGGTTKVLDYAPNSAAANLYIKAGGDITLTPNTTSKEILLSYSHPTNGANVTITAANGKVLSAITVNGLGHVTSVSHKTLAEADIPSLSASKITSGTFSDTLIPSLSWNKITSDKPTTLSGYGITDGLSNATTFFGQTVSNGVVGGNMTGVGNISFASTGKNIGSVMYFDTVNSRIGVGNSSPTRKLDVNGTFYASGNSAIGGTFSVSGATTLSSSLTVDTILHAADLDLFVGNAENEKNITFIEDVRGADLSEYSEGDEIESSWYINTGGDATFSSVTIGETLAVGSTLMVSSTTTLTGILSANGGIVVPSGKTIKIGNGYLSWDGNNNAIRVSANADGTGAVNFYAVGGVSALGQSNSGSGGGGASSLEDLNDVLISNKANKDVLAYDVQSTRWVNVKKSTYLSGYATESWVSSNFNNYSLPTASSSTLGGIKVGTTLEINSSTGLLNQKSGIATAGTAGSTFDSSGNAVIVPYITVDTYGRVTGYGTHSHTVSNLPNTALMNNSVTVNGTNVSLGGSVTTSKWGTSRTLWGQSVDGSANVSGAMTGVASIANADALSPFILFDDTAQGGVGCVYIEKILSVDSAAYFADTVGFSDQVSFEAAVSADSTLSVTGAVTLSSTLGVSGATTLSSTLSVGGATTMNSPLTINSSDNEHIVLTESGVGSIILFVDYDGLNIQQDAGEGSGFNHALYVDGSAVFMDSICGRDSSDNIVWSISNIGTATLASTTVGGTLSVSDNVTLANAKNLFFKDTSNNAISVLNMQNNNVLVVGAGMANQSRAYNTFVRGNSITLQSYYSTDYKSLATFANTGITTTVEMSVGGAVSASGNISSAGTLSCQGDISTSSGNIYTRSSNGAFIQIGDIRIVYDNAVTNGNNALKIVKSDGTPANLYATGGVSALGQSSISGGGGGGASSLADLNDVSLISPASGDVLKYNGTHWVNVTLATLMTNYATTSWVNTNYATKTSLSGYMLRDVVDDTTYSQGIPTTSIINGDQLIDVVSLGNDGKIHVHYSKLALGSLASLDGLAFSDLTSHPTTLSGYGISDAVTLNTAQTITGAKTFNEGKWVLVANDNNEITSKLWDSTTLYNCADGAPANGASAIRSSIRFRYNDTYWVIGNAKKNTTTDSYGFVIGKQNAAGTHVLNCFRVDTDGVYVNDYKVWHENNDGADSGLDADKLDGQHGSYYAKASDLSDYVTLNTTQTISGGKTFTVTLALNVTANNYPLIKYYSGGTYWGSIGFSAADNPSFYSPTDTNWYNFLTLRNYASHAVTLSTTQTITGTKTFKGIVYIGNYGNNIEGGEIRLLASDQGATYSGTVIDNYNGDMRIFGVPSSDGTTRTGVGTPLVISPYNKTITGGYTITGTLNGNASTATTLQNTRTLWGQSFDGSANVSGAMSGVTDITMSGKLISTNNNTTKLWLDHVGDRGRIRIYAPDSYTYYKNNTGTKANQFWEIDALSGNLRFYTYQGGDSTHESTTRTVSFDRAGTILAGSLYAGSASATGEHRCKVWSNGAGDLYLFANNSAKGLFTENVGSGETAATKGIITVSKDNKVVNFYGNINGNVNTAQFIEFTGVRPSAGHGGYIDFHYNGSTADYTSRIIEQSSGVIGINGALSTTGAISCSATISSQAGLSTSGTLSASGNTTIGGTLGVTGVTTLSSTLSAGATTLSSLTVNGATTFNNTINIGSYEQCANVWLYGGVQISGSVTASEMEFGFIDGFHVNLLDEAVDGSDYSELSTYADTNGYASLMFSYSSDNLFMGSNLYMTNLDGVWYNLYAQSISASGSLSVTGGTTLSSTLSVSGATTLSSTLSVADNITLANNKYLKVKNTGGTALSAMVMTNGNAFILGYDMIANNYVTYLRGSNVDVQVRNSSGTNTSVMTFSSGSILVNNSYPISHPSNTDLFIGNSSNIKKVKLVEDMAGWEDDALTWELDVDGTAWFKNTTVKGNFTVKDSNNNNISQFTSSSIHAYVGFYSDSYVSALGQNTSSDIRMKDVIDYNALPTVEQVANAPAIRYLWKDKRDLGLQVGSVAQYWQQVLPESVREDESGMLSMQYGVISLLSTISVARKVQDHERRIKELEKECERLRFENEQLRLS